MFMAKIILPIVYATMLLNNAESWVSKIENITIK